MDRDEVIRVLRAFQNAQLEYVLIGAAALAFHGVVRVTEDLDIFIRATSENVERDFASKVLSHSHPASAGCNVRCN